jgi:hypothetical protein
MCWPASGDATLAKATVYEQDVFQSVIATSLMRLINGKRMLAV